MCLNRLFQESAINAYKKYPDICLGKLKVKQQMILLAGFDLPKRYEIDQRGFRGWSIAYFHLSFFSLKSI